MLKYGLIFGLISVALAAPENKTPYPKHCDGDAKLIKADPFTCCPVPPLIDESVFKTCNKSNTAVEVGLHYIIAF